MIKRKFECADANLLPDRKKKHEKLESYKQSVATHLVPTLMQLSYEDKLDKLNLTLEEKGEKRNLSMRLKAVKGNRNCWQEESFDKGMMGKQGIMSTHWQNLDA